MRQYIHAEDAIKASQISRPSQIHLGESDQIAQARFSQKVLANLREVGLQLRPRQIGQSALRIEPALSKSERFLTNITRQNVNAPTARIAAHGFANRETD